MKFSKWISGTKPDDSVQAAAVRSLRSRLRAVQHFLPLAAKKADQDIEHVHSLRVSVRRAVAALRLYRKFTPRRRAAWIEKQVKRIHKAAGNARDCDVLLQRYALDPLVGPESQFLQKVVEQRRDAQSEIIAVYRDLKAGGRFDRRIAAFLKRVKRRNGKAGKSARFDTWAIKQARRVVQKFFAAVPADTNDMEALHEFRISGKKLRYGMELLAGAFPAGFSKQLYPQFEELQEKLGEINDRVVAQARLRDWIESTQAEFERQHLQCLLNQEVAGLEANLSSFPQWCSPQRIESLRAAFDNYLGTETAQE